MKSEGHKIPHNKINKYLLDNNFTIPDPKKQKQRKRCRYERSIQEVWFMETGTEQVNLILMPNKNKETSEFEKYLVSQSIKHIPSRRNNPQTNGKLERFWYEYDKHRWRFSSLQEFLKWYNSRIHGSLDYRNGENPGMAFIRKMPPAAILGLFFSRSEQHEKIL
ncbi:MAG: hypothetical protein OIN90_12590 [Candidatus Methanoperedens sp.]|nr:hypothetical protein [Candidatus Methanoperedens sp.]